jgi:sulfite reductase (NADPH) flavoprotein alpha-component
MLAEHKLKILQDLISGASKEDLAWINTYISSHLGPVAAEPAATPKFAAGKVTIAYGTETGNSKRVATDFAARAKKIGINAKLISLDQYRLNDLPKEEYFLTVISTQGEGEPPEAAKKFYDHIHNNGFKLDKLKYSVLALGDTSYPLFCKAGEDVDEQLLRLGGNRIADIQKCDVEYDEEAQQWFDRVLGKLATTEQKTTVAAVTAPAEKKAAGKKTYTGTVLTNINLNDRGSNKETYHIEIAADEVEYEPGDSIGIVPENAVLVVENILSLSKGINAGKKIQYKNESYTIFDLLKYKLNISHLITAVIKRYATIVGREIAESKMDLQDMLKKYPVKDAAQFEEILGILNPIAPRLYTMASSPSAHSGEVHAIVAKDVFIVNEENKFGVCSANL